MDITLLKIIIVLILLINIFVSLLLFRRVDLSNIYKVTTGLAVWLLPVIGALGVWSLNRSHDDYLSKNSGNYQDNSTYGSVSEDLGGGGDGGGE